MNSFPKELQLNGMDPGDKTKLHKLLLKTVGGMFFYIIYLKGVLNNSSSDTYLFYHLLKYNLYFFCKK